MRYARLTAYPDDAPVTLAECKEYLRRQDTTQFDDTIRMMRDAASLAVERRSRRALAPASFAGYLDRWPASCDPIRIPVEPVDEVTAITYRDSEGAEQSIPLGEVDITYEGGRALITPNGTFSNPSVYQFTSNPITIAFSAGYDFPHDGTGTGADEAFRMDSRIKIVILMLVQHWFENRGAVRVGEQVFAVDLTVEALLGQLDSFGT